MGRDKAWIPVGGTPLVALQAARLAEAFAEVVVSAKDPAPFLAAGLRVIRDPETDHAAIYGIRAALAELRRPIFALAVDLPRFPPALGGALARALLESAAPCVVPAAGGVVQGLCAAYSPAMLPAIEARIVHGRMSIRGLVAESGGSVLGEDFWGPWGGPEIFENWNRPGDHDARQDG